MTGSWPSDDAKRWMARVMTVVAAISLLAWLGALVVVYWGDGYTSPAWDEQSVPPPKTY